MAHPDPRTTAAKGTDAGVVTRQIQRMRDSERARTYQRDLFGRIQSDRRSPGRRTEVSYDVAALDTSGGFLVAVTGEVLVRTASRARAGQVLGAAGFAESGPVPQLDNKVTRFVKPNVSVAATNALARGLRAEGIGASVNYIVPLGYIAKGEGGFEPTDVLDTYRGPGNPTGGVQVAVIDTGIAAEPRTDDWLTGVARTDLNVDRLYSAGMTLDFSAGHGEFTAGVVQQVCPSADIRMYRAIDSDGIGSEIEIAAAILQAGREGASVINLSLGTETADDAPPVGLQVALEILAAEQCPAVLVAAAGNSGTTRPCWPAAFRPVVAVAGLTPALHPSTWSNHGSWVDCSTIGEGIVSTYVQGKESPIVDKDDPDTFPANAWAVGTGTSFAAPQISGQLAQLLTDTPGLTARGAVQQLLRPGGGGVPVPSYGMGMEILPGTGPGS